MFKNFKYSIIVFLAPLIIGCVHVTKPLKVTDQPAVDKGYLYGKFKLSEQSPNMDIVLILRNVDNEEEKKKNPYKKTNIKKYGLKFNKKQDVYTVAVKPGRYRLHGFEYGTGGQLQDSSSSISDAEGIMSRVFQVEPGKAYYMGDWYGSGTITNAYPMTYYKWKLDKIGFNYESTTKEFLAQYKKFNAISFATAFELEYSSNLDRNDPNTFTVYDLEQAISYAEYDFALKIAEHLKNDSPDAKAYLGYFYEKGIGVEKDMKKALDLYHEAVKDKSAQAMWMLGVTYNEFARYYEKGTEQREKYQDIALKLIESASMHGHPKAIAMQCKVFAAAENPVEMKSFGMAWCEVGKKILNAKNEHHFKNTPVVDDKLIELANINQEKKEEIKIKILERMMENKVKFAR